MSNFGLESRLQSCLLEKIPILGSNDNELLNFVINYCINKGNNISIYNIKRTLDKLYKNNEPDKRAERSMLPGRSSEEQPEGFPKINKVVNKDMNKIIKSYKITCNALIESMIQCTLTCYFRLNRLRIPNMIENTLNIIPSSSNVRFKNNYILSQTMNEITGDLLSNYIVNFYKKDDLTINQKNQKILDLLIHISYKLGELQSNYGFIHGDFHSGNIFISENGNIIFIDFEYSTIRLYIDKLFNQKNYVTLSSPIIPDIQFNYPLDITIKPWLKAVDMFHLINELKTLTGFGEKYYKHYQLFIKKIENLYFYKDIDKDIRKFERIHNFAMSYHFNNLSFKILYPENFCTLTLNKIDNAWIASELLLQSSPGRYGRGNGLLRLASPESNPVENKVLKKGLFGYNSTSPKTPKRKMNNGDLSDANSPIPGYKTVIRSLFNN